jgi:hypothetical protein
MPKISGQGQHNRVGTLHINFHVSPDTGSRIVQGANFRTSVEQQIIEEGGQPVDPTGHPCVI